MLVGVLLTQPLALVAHAVSNPVSVAAEFDPVAGTLLSVFGGVAVTAIAGFFGAWVQGRREHRRWVRERRYEAFQRANRLISHMEAFAEERDQPTHDYFLEMLGARKTTSAEEREALERKIVEHIGPRMTAAEEMARFRALDEERVETSSVLELVGTAEVQHWLGFVINAQTDQDESELKYGQTNLRHAMRLALGVKDEAGSRRRSRRSRNAVTMQSRRVSSRVNEQEARLRADISADASTGSGSDRAR